MTEPATQVRLFASARHAVGRAEVPLAELGIALPATPAAVLDALVRLAPGAGEVLEVCSVLVDGLRHELDGPVEAAETIDVLPPFAGG